MSRLRPSLTTYYGKDRTLMEDGTAYLMIYNAVRDQPGLIHGRLETPKGEYCAIGSYFEVNPRTCLPTDMIDEVAAFNDSMPKLTMIQRKRAVMRWLAWKLKQLGMPQFASAKGK